MRKFLAVNQVTVLGHFERPQTLYIKQYGPGNLRLAPTKDELDSTITLAPGDVQDGRVQATIDGWVQLFWEGDLWAISDQAGMVVWIAPGYEFWIARQLSNPDSTQSVQPVAGSLGTAAA